MAPSRPIRILLIAVILLAAGYAVVRLDGGSNGARAEGPPAPSAAADPWNPAILIEGGTVERRHSVPGTAPVGPRSTYDEVSFASRPIAGFRMQQHEVTNVEYRRFDPDHRFAEGRERHPVTGVTWEEATAYAESLGGTLPTEAQWQFAAGGTEGRTYPWGEEEPTCERANFRGCGPRGTVEVMSFPDGATPEGLHDLAGNVWEWVMPIWFEPGRTPVNDETRRLRGGSFDDEPFFLRNRNRNNDFFEGFRMSSVGFRVIWPLDR